jgi:hypothetical protein
MSTARGGVAVAALKVRKRIQSIIRMKENISFDFKGLSICLWW